MIELNRSHPSFSMDMEVLATLSTMPIKREDLCEDFGLSRQELTRIERRLRPDFGVCGGNVEGRSAMRVMAAYWNAARHAANNYLEVVYGG